MHKPGYVEGSVPDMSLSVLVFLLGVLSLIPLCIVYVLEENHPSALYELMIPS